MPTGRGNAKDARGCKKKAMVKGEVGGRKRTE